MKKVDLLLVLGGAGFLGSVIARDGENYGWTAISADIQSDDEVYDLTQISEVDRFFDNVLAEYQHVGRIALVVSTGRSVFSDTSTRSEDEVRLVLESNVGIPIYALNALNRVCSTRGLKGSAVLISSVFAAHVPDFSNYEFLSRRNSEVYGASKAGVEQLTRYYANLLGPAGLRVNAVAPGGLYQPEVHSEDFVASYLKSCALGEMTEASDVSGAVFFLLSDAAQRISGQILRVDSGYGLG